VDTDEESCREHDQAHLSFSNFDTCFHAGGLKLLYAFCKPCKPNEPDHLVDLAHTSDSQTLVHITET
jgi:hypothetical protein